MRKGILSIGTTVVDTVKMIDALPEKSHVAIVHSSSRHVGGNVPNVLIDLAVMDPSLVLEAAAVVGCDLGGEFLIQELKKHGIDTSFITQSPRAGTSASDIMTLVSTGERTVFYYKGASSLITLEDLEKIKSSAKIVQIAYLGTLDELEQDDPKFGSKIAHALYHFSAQGAKTCIDIVSVNIDGRLKKVVQSCLPHTDYFIVNELEAMDLLGIETRTKEGSLVPENLEKAVKEFIKLGARECAVIHCPETAVYYDKNGVFAEQPSYKIDNAQIKGTVGAGDAFMAAFLYSMHQGFSPMEALKYGHASAHFNLQNAGAVEGAPPFAEIQKFVNLF